MSGSGEDRSEKASPQRMRKVRQEGNLSRSQDLSAWLVVGAAAVVIPGLIHAVYEELLRVFDDVSDVAESPEPARAWDALASGLSTLPAVLGTLFVVVALTALVGSAAQGGVHFASKRLKPKFESLNPLKGLKRIFGPQAWWQGVKVLAKSALVGFVLYTVIVKMVPFVRNSGAISVRQMLGEAESGFTTLMWTAVAAGLLLAVIDVIVVIRRNRKHTRMSKKELKDEHKNTEGNPLIKGAIRGKQIAMSRNRMIAAVADAEVVVVNPTHIAVALKYREGVGVPQVVAKGRGHIAARIKEEALKRRIPVVQDIPLARALEAECDLGAIIPNSLYQDVARVLAFIMSLRRRGAAAGTHTMPAAGTHSRTGARGGPAAAAHTMPVSPAKERP